MTICMANPHECGSYLLDAAYEYCLMTCCHWQISEAQLALQNLFQLSCLFRTGNNFEIVAHSVNPSLDQMTVSVTVVLPLAEMLSWSLRSIGRYPCQVIAPHSSLGTSLARETSIEAVYPRRANPCSRSSRVPGYPTRRTWLLGSVF